MPPWYDTAASSEEGIPTTAVTRPKDNRLLPEPLEGHIERSPALAGGE